MIIFATNKQAHSQKKQHELAYQLLKRELSRRGMNLDEMEIALTAQGKPFFPGHKDLHFNLSHCPTAVALAIGKRPLGVDVERIRGFSEGAASMAFTEDERKQLLLCSRPDLYGFSLWVLKESAIKLLAASAGPKMKSISFESLFLTDISWIGPKKRLVYIKKKNNMLSLLYSLGDHLLGISVDIS